MEATSSQQWTLVIGGISDKLWQRSIVDSGGGGFQQLWRMNCVRQCVQEGEAQT
jgi:hypothetical protein